MITIAVVIYLIISDFRSRMVSLVSLLAFGLCVLWETIGMYGVENVIRNTVTNLIIVGVMASGVVLYLLIKTGKVINPLKVHVGIGDLIFILLLTPIDNFIEFLTTGLICTLIYWVFKRDSTIPLVGTLGIIFCIYRLLS